MTDDTDRLVRDVHEFMFSPSADHSDRVKLMLDFRLSRAIEQCESAKRNAISDNDPDAALAAIIAESQIRHCRAWLSDD